MARAESFAELFRIVADDEGGVYWHANGDASYCWLCHPISAEHLSGEQRHELANQLGRVISSLPGGATLQFIVANVPNVDWALRDYLAQGGSSNRFLRQYELNKAKAFKAWCEGLRDTVGADVTAKTIQVLIVLTISRSSRESHDELVRSVRDAMSKRSDPVYEGAGDPIVGTSAHARATEEATIVRETLLSKVAGFRRAFASMRMPHVPCDKRNFIRFVRTMIHPKTGANEPVTLDDEVNLPEQICLQRIETSGRGKFIHSDDTYSIMLTADAYPQPPPGGKGVYAGILSLISYDLEAGLSPIDLLKDSILCVSLRVVDRQVSEQWVEQQRSLAGKGSSDKNEDALIFNDCDEAIAWVRQDRRALVDICISLKVNGPSEPAATTRANEVMKVFDQLGFHFRPEDTDGLTHWACMLPGGFVGSASDGGHRYRRKRDIIAACCAPIFMTGRGTKTYRALNFNEHYEPSALYTFEHPKSFNLAAVGEPGSGKSNSLGSLLTDHVRNDRCQGFVIDYGGSQTLTTEMLGEEGLDQVLSLKIPQANNPFAGPAELTIPMMLDWIPSLFLEDNERLAPETIALMERALYTTYREKLRRDIEFTSYAQFDTDYAAYFPTNIRKRFLIRYLDRDAFQHVRSVLRGDEARRPRFELYLVLRLMSFTNQHGDRVPLRVLRDLDESVFADLENRYKYLEEDEEGVYVLSPMPESVEHLMAFGFEVETDQQVMIVEAERLEDFQAVCNAGAQILYDNVFMEDLRTRQRDLLIERYGPNDPRLGEFLEEDLRKIDPNEYFEWLIGLVDLQGEVVFSDFIRTAKAMQEEALNAVVLRLSMWYGSGTYAEFFDRPGGVDIARYKLVNWDFKPIFPPGVSRRFAIAMLGAILTRLSVYCNSIRTMGKEKIIVIDEYFEFRKNLGPIVSRFVDTATNQARKNGYGVWLGTQKFEHLVEDNLVNQFQHYLICSQYAGSHTAIQKYLELTDEQMAVVSAGGVDPGKKCDAVLYVPATGTLEILRMVQTPFEYWLRTTTHSERDVRSDTITKYRREHNYGPTEAFVMAAKELSQLYPRGLRVTQQVEI